MVLLFVLLACVALYGVKVSSHHEDYISKPVTDSIKGIFAIIIILPWKRVSAFTGKPYVAVRYNVL